MARVYRGVRNTFCGLLALGVITLGRVRRMRNRVFDEGVVTPIYFHQPNARLFAQCIRWLTKHGYTFISTHELLGFLYEGKSLPRGAVWLSFDDGCRELLMDVLPLIRGRKIPITLFIPSGIIAGDGLFPWIDHQNSSDPRANSASLGTHCRDSMTLAELLEVAQSPEVTIGSHTVGHTFTPDLGAEQARFELGESKRMLESWIGEDVKSFAYPDGRFDGGERRFLVEFDYRLAVNTESGFINRETDPYRVPRFCVADKIFFPEAICNMVGVWRPTLDPLIHFLHSLKEIYGRQSWMRIFDRISESPQESPGTARPRTRA
jgi:peptidoglycan/xylan/chitin deacetylase (PgdA/CDA1 family)